MSSFQRPGPSSGGTGTNSNFEEDDHLVINPVAVASEFMQIVEIQFSRFKFQGDASEKDHLFAQKLYDVFLELLDDFVFIEDEEIDKSNFDEPLVDYDWTQEQPDTKMHGNELSLATKIRIVNTVNQHPNWSLATLHRNGCADLARKSDIKIWKQQIAEGGTRRQKCREINEYVLEQFKEARKECRVVKTLNLQQWAIHKAKSLEVLDFFKASKTWAIRFKSLNKISSRKVTHLVNRHEVLNPAQIESAVDNFRSNTKQRMEDYPPYAVMNTDQVGFCYELLSNRTLTNTGEKKVFGFAQSPTNLATHSYTAQYTVNFAGNIVGNVFVCLQELNGKLGPQVEKGVFKTNVPNVTLTCSRSGKLSKSLVKYYLENVVVPEVKEDFLFIVDSWGGHTDPKIYSEVFGHKNDKPEIELLIIPEKCTSYCQPLDTTFHRQLKNLARRIINYNDIFIDPAGIHKEDRITTRNGILKLQSLLHHQLSAPIFNSMIRYSFFSSGLSSESESFLNVNEACFKLDNKETCYKCASKDIFINCSWCRKFICFECFYFALHTNECQDYQVFVK